MKTFKIQYSYEVTGTLTIKAKSKQAAEAMVDEMLDDGMEWPSNHSKFINLDNIGHRDYFTF